MEQRHRKRRDMCKQRPSWRYGASPCISMGRSFCDVSHTHTADCSPLTGHHSGEVRSQTVQLETRVRLRGGRVGSGWESGQNSGVSTLSPVTGAVGWLANRREPGPRSYFSSQGRCPLDGTAHSVYVPGRRGWEEGTAVC